MAGYSKDAERQNKALGNLLKGEKVEKRAMVGYTPKQKEKGDIKSVHFLRTIYTINPY